MVNFFLWSLIECEYLHSKSLNCFASSYNDVEMDKDEETRIDLTFTDHLCHQQDHQQVHDDHQEMLAASLWSLIECEHLHS